MPVPRELLEVMACPKCHGDLKERGMFLICEKCKIAYPVLKDAIPDMLEEDAWELEKAEKAGFKHDLKL